MGKGFKIFVRRKRDRFTRAQKALWKQCVCGEWFSEDASLILHAENSCRVLRADKPRVGAA